MVEVLEFIFRDFWTWAGSLVMLTVTVFGIATTVEAIRK
jgi:hypothetical protein